MRDYMGRRYHLKRQQIIDLLGGKCARCGARGKLVIDHKDKRKKKMRSADVHSTNDAAVQQELKNLQLLCPKCHHEKSLESWDFNAPKPHHGYWMYKRHGCRCPTCVREYKKKNREWRTNRLKKLKLSPRTVAGAEHIH